MADNRAEAARDFAAFWKEKGYEKGQSQAFWLSLLEVYGVEHPERYIEFEDQVLLDSTSFIDGYIPATRVMIEQKSRGKDLAHPIKQSDGTLLTPFQQAKRYIMELPVDRHPRYVITCNFEEFWVYDMNKPAGEPEKILLSDLEREYYRLQFLVESGNEHLRREMEVSVKAGEIVGLLYDAFMGQYRDSTNEHTLHSLNVLCVRLVFCLYAENAGIFGRWGMFRDYLNAFETRQLRTALVELFKTLDTKPQDRDPYLADDNPVLAAFPYVNGGLFSDSDIEIPPFTDEIRTLLIEKASEGFNWSEISPTIFGAVFESTLNPETRRSGGMHYTSIENIHKVIDPLFLNALTDEFNAICEDTVTAKRRGELTAFQEKLASLTFLDPACGSGNFLTEAYISLRRLENNVLRELAGDGQITLGGEFSPIKVSIQQFYGIEINDFAVSVATTALWIAEHKMMCETESIVGSAMDFLPLKTYSNIVEGNALRLDWNEVIPKERLTYIMGNPPFVGYSNQSREQKEDILSIYIDEKGRPYSTAGKIDYVSGWYFKASQLMAGTSIRAAFVSTNSITQGEQVAAVWKPLFDRFGIHIDFAHRTFRWDSEASLKAHVHCVIISFSIAPNDRPKMLYDGDIAKEAKNINAYLMDAENIYVESRKDAICEVPDICKGFQATDNGCLILSEEERRELLKIEPEAEKWIRQYSMGEEFINNIPRYCLWLVDIKPNELRQLSAIKKRVNDCRLYREQAPVTGDAYKLRNVPHLFRPCKLYQDVPYIAVPLVSSENRRYIPMGFVDNGMIPGNNLFCIFNASLYHFGVLTSNVHMAWIRAVGGRMEMRYRYSKDVVYNNFPWPEPTEEQKRNIEQTAQAILDARAAYPDSSLADLYDEVAMPPELRRAHQENDRAVMAAYGWSKTSAAYRSESACVASLLSLHLAIIAGN